MSNEVDVCIVRKNGNGLIKLAHSFGEDGSYGPHLVSLDHNGRILDQLVEGYFRT